MRLFNRRKSALLLAAAIAACGALGVYAQDAKRAAKLAEEEAKRAEAAAAAMEAAKAAIAAESRAAEAASGDGPKPSDAKLLKLIPAGYRFAEELRGDLNGDGAEDLVLIIWGTDKSKVGDGYDENRRGVMIFFNDGGNYKLALENRKCFSGTEEYCGACLNMQLSFKIARGNLYVIENYPGHRSDDYGAEISYTFRYRNSEFELIGVDNDNAKEKGSVNILSKKKVVKQKKKGAKEEWSDIPVKEPILLRKIGKLDRFELDIALGIKSRFGTFTYTDRYFGEEKTYKTVKMPDDETWLAENLDIQTKAGNVWCYDNKGANCKKYGRLYDWETAREVCPTDWHLPTRDEWSGLAEAVSGVGGAKTLKSATGWSGGGNGTDDYGFSALPGGYYSNGAFSSAGGNWWTSTEQDNADAVSFGMRGNSDKTGEYLNGKTFGLSVRCVRDY